MDAIIDTGNQLTDPATGDPVHIIGRDAVPDVWKRQPVQGIRYLPYHSIGKENGMIPVIRIEKMYVQGEQERWVNGPLIGICKEKVAAKGTYNMILNPDIF